MNWQNTLFVRSAADPGSFIEDSLPKLAFAGRSNVGKSSVINRLTGKKNLARVGNTPGKTAHVNYFRTDGKLWLVDLPGYGYAKVSREEKKRWATLMETFFRTQELACGVLIVDARHKPTEDDVMMAGSLSASGRPFLVLANKWDKLRPSETEGALATIRETLGAEPIPFSAEKGTGRETVLAALEAILAGRGRTP